MKRVSTDGLLFLDTRACNKQPDRAYARASLPERTIDLNGHLALRNGEVIVGKFHFLTQANHQPFCKCALFASQSEAREAFAEPRSSSSRAPDHKRTAHEFSSCRWVADHGNCRTMPTFSRQRRPSSSSTYRLPHIVYG